MQARETINDIGKPRRRLLDRRAVEAEYGISKRYLEIAAFRGDGPPYIKIGRSVRYSAADLDAWIATRRVEPGGWTA
ncbi:MAG: AlpA family transcriptional regulator [Pseudomonadota bacterium]